jgi:hypothetical protein
MNKTPEQINAEKQTLSAKMINDLKIKNQYLPLIFKEISAFGFAEDNANNANNTVKDDDDFLYALKKNRSDLKEVVINVPDKDREKDKEKSTRTIRTTTKFSCG